MRFRNIRQWCKRPAHRVDVGWDFLPEHMRIYIEEYNLDVNPDFQRGHVWTNKQKTEYCEYILQGGISGKEIYVNCPEWFKGKRELFVLVDGKQRLNAVLSFLNNEVPVFSYYYRDFSDRPDIMVANFSWNVHMLETRDEVLNWYIMLNSGGTPHNATEIERVRKLLGTKEKFDDDYIFNTVKESDELEKIKQILLAREEKRNNEL